MTRFCCCAPVSGTSTERPARSEPPVGPRRTHSLTKLTASLLLWSSLRAEKICSEAAHVMAGRFHPAASDLCTAVRLEASDDMLAAGVFASLSLVERLRLVTVSKRWRGLLLAHLHFPRELTWRAPHILRQAGSDLRSLHLEGPGETPDRGRTVSGVLQARGGAPGANLRTLVTWQPEDDVFFRSIYRHRGISLGQARQLSASCPNLDDSTRVAFEAAGAAEAVAMLNMLPGRHTVHLMAAEEEDAAEDSIEGHLRHPRLCTLGVELEDASEDSYSAALDAVACALERGESSVESFILFSQDNDEHLPAFADAGAVQAAFEGTAALQLPAKPCSLRRLHLPCGAPAAFCCRVLLAPRESLKHVMVNLNSVVETNDRGAAALTALLHQIGGGLESLCISTMFNQREGMEPGRIDGYSTTAYLLPGLSPLLSSRGCRLRALSLDEFSTAAVGAEAAAAPSGDDDPLVSFLRAFSTNRSLEALDMSDVDIGGREIALLADALAARASPIRSLCADASAYSPSGAPATDVRAT